MNSNPPSTIHHPPSAVRRPICFAAILWLVLTVLVQSAAAELVLEQQTLFQAGVGYPIYRIPALAVTNSGTVLAFCEGRSSGSDFGNIDLVLKRSLDGGQTWLAMQVVADDGAHTIGNPCPVVDRSTGTIWLPFCRNNKTVLLTKSTDDGLTWSAPIDITASAKHLAATNVYVGPGHGVQLASGRLLIPCCMDETWTLDQIQTSYAFYSDDHGLTWNVGQAADSNASDEWEAVQLADGSVYMNARRRTGQTPLRVCSISSDGGETWGPTYNDLNLPDFSCQGSVVRFTDDVRHDRNRILFSNPAAGSRVGLTVRLSYDEADTWPVSKLLCEGYSGYSDLAVTDDHMILCLYETDSCRKITLACFNLEWLSDGADAVVPEPGTFVLAAIALGLIGLAAAYARRKRR